MRGEWLRLLRESKLVNVDNARESVNVDELLSILTSIVMTAKQGQISQSATGGNS